MHMIANCPELAASILEWASDHSIDPKWTKAGAALLEGGAKHMLYEMAENPKKFLYKMLQDLIEEAFRGTKEKIRYKKPKGGAQFKYIKVRRWALSRCLPSPLSDSTPSD